MVPEEDCLDLNRRMQMRDIINRLNEAAKFGPPGQPAPLSASEQMATEIGAELEQFVYSAHDRIETILKTEGAALSARMPGYYIVLSGGHGMTQVEVYPPPSSLCKPTKIRTVRSGPNIENWLMF